MTAPELAVLPGRAGRIWLVGLLEAARRGADLLDRKLRISRGKLARLQTAADEGAVQWDRRQAEAENWLLRAALLGGERAIRLTGDGQAAGVRISYETTMDIRYPSEAACTIPPAATWDSPVVARARRAPHRACGSRPARSGRGGSARGGS